METQLKRKLIYPKNIWNVIFIRPLLFFMYINDLHNAIKFPQTIHYVDDPCLLINEKKNLKSINYWLKTFLLLKCKLNSFKCCKNRGYTFQN